MIKKDIMNKKNIVLMMVIIVVDIVYLNSQSYILASNL